MAKPKSAASILADAATAHAFTLLRVAAGSRQNALAILEELQAELVTKADQFAKLTNPAGAAFKGLEAQTTAIISAAYKLIGKGQLRDLEEMAMVEGDWMNRALNEVFGGVEIFTKKIDPKILEAVSGPIILGHTSNSWWAGQAAALRSKFSGEMAKGLLLGETGDEMVRRIRGTKIKGTKDQFAGGIMQVSKRDAESLVYTSAQSVTNFARIESFKGRKAVKGIEWLSTLDSRTTLICMGLDGKQWRLPDFVPIGHDKAFPGPIAHWRCRSTQIAVTYSWEELAGVELPELDGKKLQERLEEKLKADGKTPEQIAGAIANARASMDGQVSSGLTFETWAKAKGPAFVESVIGPGRYSLWNTGQITFSELTDQNNRPLTIAQLKAAVASGKPPPETLGATFNAPPAKKPFFDVAAAAKAAAEEAKAKAEAIAAEQAQKAAEQAAIDKAALEARIEAQKKAAEDAANRLAAAEEDAKKAAELQAKAEAALAAEKEAAAKAAEEAAAKLKKLVALGKKFAKGKPFTKAEQAFVQTLDQEEKETLQEQWEAMKDAEDAKQAAKAAKLAAKQAAEAAKAAAAAKTLEDAQRASQAASSAARAADNTGIPTPDTLKLKSRLGGSTGAELHTAPDGSLWVVKRGSSPDHVREEFAADMLYRALGANVPEAGLFETDSGPVKVSRYLEGSQTLAEAWATPARRKQIEEGLREHFAADALMGNWDVIGMNRDNILVTADGKVWRIDNGGSLRFRAMGTKKTGTEWDGTPKELFDMRDPAKNPQAAAFFGKVSLQDTARQVERWPKGIEAAVNGSILPEAVRSVLMERVKEMQLFAARTLDMDADGWEASYAERFTRAVFSLKEKGIREALPSKLTSSAGNSVILEDDKGRPFYGLRKPPAAGATGDAIGDAIMNAVKTINHKATAGGAPNAAKVTTALQFKGILEAWEKHGSPEDKAKAAEYLPWINKISTYGTGKLPPANLGMFTHFKATAAAQTRTQSVVADMWQAFEAKHGPAGARALGVLRDWQAGQAGDSWSKGALVAKAWMMARRGGDWYVGGNTRYASSEAKIKAAWKEAVATVGDENVLMDVFTFQHALTQELFDHTALPNTDRTARAVRLVRTESEAMLKANGITPGKYAQDVRLQLGAIESHSLVTAYAFLGDRAHSTLAAVPFHRALGAYAFERSPGVGFGAFMGDGENEVTADTSGIPKRYLSWSKKEEANPDAPASAWGVPLSHLRPR